MTQHPTPGPSHGGPTTDPPTRSSSWATALGVLASVLAGSCVSIQSRANGQLGHELGDPYAAGLISFGTGLVLCVLGVVAFPSGRRGLGRLPGLLRAGTIPWWYLIAGVFGAFLVAVQTQVTVALGVSVFILGLVVGQSLGGLVVDRLGIGPGGVRPVSLYRLLGTAIIIAAVLVAMLPRLTAGTGGAGVPVLIAMALLPVLAGVGSSVQTAWNAGLAARTSTPVVSTFTNFAAGTLALGIATAIVRGTQDLPAWHWPTTWWLYIGGPAGIVFIAAAAVLARRVGVLQTSLGMVTGMLLGALVLDVLLPTPASLVTPVTVLGTLGTLIGLVVVTLPWRRAPRFARGAG